MIGGGEASALRKYFSRGRNSLCRRAGGSTQQAKAEILDTYTDKIDESASFASKMD